MHCSSLSRVFSEPMTSFECIKPTKETFERLTAPVGCARRACAGAEVAGGRPILNVEMVSSRCIARRHPSRTALRRERVRLMPHLASSVARPRTVLIAALFRLEESSFGPLPASTPIIAPVGSENSIH